ncbi:Disulfide bond formation protein B [compost metagenome]
MNAMRFFRELPFSRPFWMTILLGSLGAEAVAICFQYLLHEDPCAICVQIRALVMLIGLTGLLGLMLPRQSKRWQLLPHALLLLSLLKVAALSSKAVLIEQGRIFATCGMDAGFPKWLALDSWLPAVFAPTGLCGKAIAMIPGWQAGPTMSESLYMGSVTLFLVVALMLIESFVLHLRGSFSNSSNQ